MFRRKKDNMIKRCITRIREYYLYCKIYVAEKAAKGMAVRYMARAHADTTKGIGGKWLRFKTRMTGRKYFAQAAVCRYARRSGTYKNL